MIENFKLEKKPKGCLTGNQRKILEYLIYNGASYAARMAKKLNTNTTGISENLKLLEKKYPGLILSEWRKKPANEIKLRDMAKYYKIVNEKLAQELLGEFIFLWVFFFTFPQ